MKKSIGPASHSLPSLRGIPFMRTDADRTLESVSRAAAELERRHLSFKDRHLVRIEDAGRFAKLVTAA